MSADYDHWKTTEDYDGGYEPPVEEEETITLHASHVELLAAARAIYQAVHGDTIATGPLWGRLHAAISHAEELTQ